MSRENVETVLRLLDMFARREHEADRVLTDVLAPLLRRDPGGLRGQVCVGSSEMCAELLSRYAEAGCRRVHFWPIDDERRQIELLAAGVKPQICRLT